MTDYIKEKAIAADFSSVAFRFDDYLARNFEFGEAGKLHSLHGRESGSKMGSVVCKHWLRGLCKKGEQCDFLHEYNLKKMPPCHFFAERGWCSNGEECLYLHLDPSKQVGVCAWYNMGFCPLGPVCRGKHVRKTNICERYLSGFCPSGPNCPDPHPRHVDPPHPPQRRKDF
ncbi:mRNA cleavage and polyadenylation specificity factor complex zinc finger subunit Yth1 [Schizosaccharomyces osmophilus]|uniref:mRNA 3'-end-processing protein n=1 Tax=Schizosaccharomyces osmophilus TaxID=2545709 RepID=A0AAE9WAL0_9SCHI|nr:mRNA cleavage and polyadenylation specificity factor complex zinc finger subunit Yth1 [Schizosaccharomyces osmophilus]WBW72660.1 mRNA cleavage and polyadenylation specificity factor complex zinc finger subunit Yth1 [Schizosaccharomyces osmophilus]